MPDRGDAQEMSMSSCMRFPTRFRVLDQETGVGDGAGKCSPKINASNLTSAALVCVLQEEGNCRIDA